MRTKLFAMLMLVVLCLAPAALAQMGSQGSGAQDQSSNMTVTGCLQAGTEPNTFMLSNVSMAASESGQTPDQMARAESSYMLIPDANVQLRKHIGEKVQVTGMPAQMGGQSTQSPSSGTSQPTQFRVSSIKKIASSCP